MAGQECIVERYSREERCVCVEYCPFFPDAEVCINIFKVNLDHAEVYITSPIVRYV